MDELKLSEMLEVYRCIENSSEHDKENEKQLEEAISKYGDITFKEYKIKRFNEFNYPHGTPRYIVEAEFELLVNHNPPEDGVETASFDDMMCDAGLW